MIVQTLILNCFKFIRVEEDLLISQIQLLKRLLVCLKIREIKSKD